MTQPGVGSKDLQVLVKLLGMLGTENPHERAAFAAKAHAWVTQRGLDWGALLIPEEPSELPLGSSFSRQSGVGGGTQRAYAARRQHAGDAAEAAAAAYNASQDAAGAWSNGPVWGHLAEEMLERHAGRLRGDREVVFLNEQLERARTYGHGVRVSDKQEKWLRDILGRAGLTW